MARAADKGVNDEPTQADATAKVAEAEAALEDARNKLAETQGELRAIVTREVPQMVVELSSERPRRAPELELPRVRVWDHRGCRGAPAPR